MRFSSTLLCALLPATIFAADNQVPIKEKAAGWLDKAKAYVSSAAPSVPNPIDAGAAKVAAQKVEKINIRNYDRKLGPKPDFEEEWMILVTGGNKTCRGGCKKTDTAWNESVPLLAALDTFQGSKLRLATLNCEHEEVLCTGFAVAVPCILHFIFPQHLAGTPRPLSPYHDIPLNMSSVKVEDIVSIPRASKARYLEGEEYTGAFHPTDGWLVKAGLLNTVGYILWGFGTTPSWLFMIAISFFSRQVMARRAANRPSIYGNQGAGQAAPGGAPAAAPASGGAAAMRGGSAKKRR